MLIDSGLHYIWNQPQQCTYAYAINDVGWVGVQGRFSVPVCPVCSTQGFYVIVEIVYLIYSSPLDQ